MAKEHVNRRISIASHWLHGRRNNVSFMGLTRFLLGQTRTRKAQAKISRTTINDQFVAVELKGQIHPLYFPKSFDITLLNEVISELLYPDHWHYYEIKQTAVSSHDVVMDCGAAEGLFTLTVASRCRHVYVVEPLPEFVQALHRSLKPYSNVEILPMALSDHNGLAFLQGQGLNSFLCENDAHGTEVTVRTVDTIASEHGFPVTYIKADLEGHEIPMLKGAIKTIRDNSPKIAITTYHHPDHASLIASFLKNVNPNYNIVVKGIHQEAGAPIMLHAWVDTEHGRVEG